jgi:ribonuclease D
MPPAIRVTLRSIPKPWDLFPVVTASALCSFPPVTERRTSFASPPARRKRRTSWACLPIPHDAKIFHYGRFDIAVLFHTFGVTTTPVFCTKIASRLTRTYTDRHGLKDNLKELLDIDVSKAQQQSDWAAETLSPAQMEYAASDVLYLHSLADRLTDRLRRDGRMELAAACFEFLPTRSKLDLLGWEETDIFAHS